MMMELHQRKLFRISQRLAEVYGTITYYLQHQAEVDRYLAGLRAQVTEAHRVNQIAGIRERLQARLAHADIRC